MKELNKLFQKGSKKFKQIKGSPKAYIYEIKDSDTKSICYEVFERKEALERILPSGSILPARVVYPSTSDFGKWAWCISRGNNHKSALNCALQRFNFLSESKEVA